MLRYLSKILSGPDLIEVGILIGQVACGPRTIIIVFSSYYVVYGVHFSDIL